MRRAIGVLGLAVIGAALAMELYGGVGGSLGLSGLLGLGWKQDHHHPDLKSVWATYVGTTPLDEMTAADNAHLESLLDDFARVYRQTFVYNTPENVRAVLLVMHRLAEEILKYAFDISQRVYNPSKLAAGRRALQSLLDEHCREAAARVGMPGLFPRPLGNGPGPIDFRSQPTDAF